MMEPGIGDSNGGGAHRGHTTSQSAQNQRELPRSQPQIRPCAKFICAGREGPRTRPGLQADWEHQIVTTVFRPCSVSSEKMTEANHQRSSSG